MAKGKVMRFNKGQEDAVAFNAKFQRTRVVVVTNTYDDCWDDSYEEYTATVRKEDGAEVCALASR